MNDLLAYFTIRTVLIFGSTAFSILFIMLVVGIITVDEAVTILHLSPDAANAFKLVVSRIQEVSGNIIDIISQLLNKMFGWAGVNIDLHKIAVDVNHHAATTADPSGSAIGSAPNSAIDK